MVYVTPHRTPTFSPLSPLTIPDDLPARNTETTNHARFVHSFVRGYCRSEYPPSFRHSPILLRFLLFDNLDPRPSLLRRFLLLPLLLKILTLFITLHSLFCGAACSLDSARLLVFTSTSRSQYGLASEEGEQYQQATPSCPLFPFLTPSAVFAASLFALLLKILTLLITLHSLLCARFSFSSLAYCVFSLQLLVRRTPSDHSSHITRTNSPARSPKQDERVRILVDWDKREGTLLDWVAQVQPRSTRRPTSPEPAAQKKTARRAAGATGGKAEREGERGKFD
jgi:hypothetical protein